jgi:spermidine/putrescine transport system permease protein
VLLTLIYNYLPYAILPLYASLVKIDNSVIEAGQDLGASQFMILTKVLIPLARSGIITAFLFIFIPSLGEFLIPDLVGGGSGFFVGNFLQNQFLSARNWPLGSAAIVLIVLLTLAFLLIFYRKINESAEAEYL